METEQLPMTSRESRFVKTIQQQTARITELYTECEHYKAEYQNSHDINAELMQRVEELERELETKRKVMQDLRSDKIRSDMFRVLEQYVRDDVDMADIGRTVVAYVDLLDWEACYGRDN